MPLMDHNDLLVWPGQAEMLQADTPIIGMFTGAGYGKSDILCRRAVEDHSKQDFWWTKPGCENWRNNPLRMIMGAPHDRYLTTTLIPKFKGYLDQLEYAIGRKIRKNTGRNRDGWFGSANERKQEMQNAVSFYFYPLHEAEAAVAVDAAGLYIDEVTMLDDPEIWRRSTMRVRDRRANSLTIACTGTPEEDHWIYEIMVDPDTKIARPGYTVITDSSIKNPALNMDYFKRQATATQAFKEMQVMGRWVAGAGGQRFGNVYDEETHLRLMDLDPRKYPKLRFSLGWDPGFRTGEVVIMYRHPRGQWLIWDEIVIQDMTTAEVCDVLISRGYGPGNIEYIGMDPRDANKKRSTSRITDQDIVYNKLKIYPKLVSQTGSKGRLRNRLDVIDEMLSTKRLLINRDLKPINSQQLGVVNAIKNFATERSKMDKEQFLDKPTRDTIQRWKHPIDAIHYVMVRFETGAYRRVDRSNYARERRG